MRILVGKRHSMVDADGGPLGLLVQPPTYRNGAVPLLKAPRSRHQFLTKALTDSAYVPIVSRTPQHRDPIS